MGFLNVGLGLVYGMVYLLSVWYNILYGVVCVVFLLMVMKYNKEYIGEKYCEIVFVLGIKGVVEMFLEDVRDVVCGEIDWLSKVVGILVIIFELGVKEMDILVIVEDVLWDVCILGNLREMIVEEIIVLY